MPAHTNSTGDGTRLFLSYARADDEPFVKRLYERLTGEGFTVWWDREHMPSRALTFLKEIRDAIRASDRVVVVIGPQCVTSDYCRAEWQAALAESRIVNPLLRLGEHGLLPPELASLHCPDFTDDAKFEDALRETLRVLHEPPPPLGPLLGGIPDIPPHFQPRPDALSELAGRILIDETQPVTLTGPQRVTVLHAMGGTGKSVLAASFGRSTSTRRSFADGIYWLTADPDSTALSISAQLGRLLGDPPHQHTRLTSSISQLTETLAAKSALLILDNAWQVEQVELLIDTLGPACRLLVTTRNAELATSTGAAAVELRLLTPEAALQHLADWANSEPAELPPEAHEVVVECGFLPFALALNGAMHHHGVAWSELAEALRAAEIDFAEQRLKGYPYPSVLKSIRVSMDVLDGEDPDGAARLCELAAFHPQDGIPEAAIRTLWQHTGALTGRHLSKLLARLDARALIRIEGAPEARRILVHDLQYDYLTRVTDAKALNLALIDAYSEACDGDWAGLSTDGYAHRYLVRHLLDADRPSDLQRLLDASNAQGANAWYEANTQLDNNSGYLADIGRVRAQADAPAALRLDLMRLSVENSLSRIPSELYRALVSAGRTTGANALAGARCIEDPDRRVAAILSLLPDLDAQVRCTALDLCLKTVRSRGRQVRARFLPVIAEQLTGDERDVLVNEALEAARAIDIPENRASALGRLMPLLSGTVRAQMCDEATAALEQSVMSSSFREAAAAVLPHLPAARAEAVLELARNIDEPFLKSIAFEAIVPHLPKGQRPAAAQEGIESFDASGANGLWIVISLARHVPGCDLDAIIRRAVMQDARQVPALIDALPDMLTGDALEKAVATIADAAAGMEEPSRTDVRIRLLAHYDPQQRAAGASALLQDIAALPYNSWRRSACSELIEYLPPERLVDARRLLSRLEDAGTVLTGAAQLAALGDEALRRRVFEVLDTMPPSREKFIGLVTLAQLVGDAQHKAVLDAACALIDYVPGWELMSEPALALAPLLDETRRIELLERACNAATRVRGFLAEEEFNRLAPILPEHSRAIGYRLLLDEAEELSHVRQQYWDDGPKVTDNASAVAETLGRIAPHLPDSLLPYALQMVDRMQSARWRWVAHGHLLARLDADQRAAFVARAREDDFFAGPDELQRFTTAACRALGRAIPSLKRGDDRDRLHDRLRDLLRAVEPGWLPGLIRDVEGGLERQELTLLVAWALRRPNIFTAGAVAPYVDGDRRWSLLAAGLRKIEPDKAADRVNANALSGIIDQLQNAPEPVRAQAWHDACARLHGDRAGVAMYLAVMAPLGASVGDESTLSAAAQGLMDVLAWWP